MRVVVIFILGLVLALMNVPAGAGTLADYKATSGQFKLENGVKVYRVLSPKPQTYQDQIKAHASEKDFERGYKKGFETAFNARQGIHQKTTIRSLKRRQTGRSRRNYGRRYSTSGVNPRYSRFRSNISYGRPAYIAFSNRD